MEYYLGPFAAIWNLPRIFIPEHWRATRYLVTLVWKVALTICAILVGIISIYFETISWGFTK